MLGDVYFEMRTIKNTEGTVIECQGKDENGDFTFRIQGVGSFGMQIQIEAMDEEMEAYINVSPSELREIRNAINEALGE